MFNVGSQELLIIFFVVLILFGAKRIPEVARSFGEGMRDLKKAMAGIEEELKVDLDDRPSRRTEPRKELTPPRADPPKAIAAPAPEEPRRTESAGTESEPARPGWVGPRPSAANQATAIPPTPAPESSPPSDPTPEAL